MRRSGPSYKGRRREDISFEILLTLKMEHRAKNKIFGELNVFSLAINESYMMNSPGLSAILDFTEKI